MHTVSQLYRLFFEKIFIYSISLVGSLYLLSCQPNDVLPDDKELLTITFDGIVVLHYTNEADAHRWQLVVPYGVDRRQLIPRVEVSPGATVVPASGQPQDFRKPVLLTVTAADGSKAVYTIIVTNQPQPVPQLTKVSVDSLEAGKSLLITGHHFGLFNLAVDVTVSKDSKLVGTLPHNVIDSTHVLVTFPDELSPGRYMIRVSVNGVPSVNSLPVEILYPTPRITKLITKYMRQEDTLQLKGDFVDLLQYTYAIMLMDNQQKTYRLPTVSGITTVATAVLPATIPPGSYQVQLLNRTTGRLSAYASSPIQIYERTKPFLTGIQDNKTSFMAGQLIAFRTNYFDAVPSRFYQVQLTGRSVSYTVNGIYKADQHVLTVELPDQLIADTYTVSCRLLDSLGQPVYQFDSDLQLSLQ